MSDYKIVWKHGMNFGQLLITTLLLIFEVFSDVNIIICILLFVYAVIMWTIHTYKYIDRIRELDPLNRK